jgi:hypothetical protein
VGGCSLSRHCLLTVMHSRTVRNPLSPFVVSTSKRTVVSSAAIPPANIFVLASSLPRNRLGGGRTVALKATQPGIGTRPWFSSSGETAMVSAAIGFLRLPGGTPSTVP